MWPSRIEGLAKIRVALRHLASMELEDVEDSVDDSIGFPHAVRPTFRGVRKAAYYVYDAVQAHADTHDDSFPQEIVDEFERRVCLAKDAASLREGLRDLRDKIC